MTEAEIGDYMEDTVTGTEGTETGRTQTERLTGAARDLVLGESATLVGEDRTGTTAEAEVRTGVVVKTPNPPTKTYRDCGVAFRTVGTEAGWRK